MLKIIEAGSWDAMDVAPVFMLRPSRDGRLCDSDIKTAAASRVMDDAFLTRAKNLELKPGDIPIHLIALGATEAYGPNRKGDGFNIATCQKQASLFEKHAKYYRHHKNKDPERSYGYVPVASYNDRMRRVELLVIGNETKEAAARNGGLVLPQKTIDKLHRGDDIPFSMACKIAHDVCQNCGNKAPTRADYCDADTCVNPHDGFQGLGCKYGLGKVASNGRWQYVENPNAHFFDISEVTVPADRIAYGAKADYLQKAASAAVTMNGAELAEYWGLREVGGSMHLGEAPDMATRLAEKEAANQFAIASPQLDAIRFRALAAATEDLDTSTLGRPGSKQASANLVALADRGVLLPPRAIVRWIAADLSEEKQAELLDAVAERLPTVFTDTQVHEGNTTLSLRNVGDPQKIRRGWALYGKHSGKFPPVPPFCVSRQVQLRRPASWRKP